MTFFLTYFEELVTRGHVYILETPLFRVRDKKQTHYCYSEDERDKALSSLKGAEVTRFKGLGEMMPKTLYNTTLAPDKRRLLQVTIPPHCPKRYRKYIMPLCLKRLKVCFWYT